MWKEVSPGFKLSSIAKAPVENTFTGFLFTVIVHFLQVLPIIKVVDEETLLFSLNGCTNFINGLSVVCEKVSCVNNNKRAARRIFMMER